MRPLTSLFGSLIKTATFGTNLAKSFRCYSNSMTSAVSKQYVDFNLRSYSTKNSRFLFAKYEPLFCSYLSILGQRNIQNQRCASGISTYGPTSEDMDFLLKQDKKLQKFNGPRKLKKRVSKMDKRPQIKGVVLKTLIRKPMKPNSANRRCCKLRLSNGKVVIAFIPGEGHNLQEHNVVLVEGGKTQDLFGVHYKVIRGKYDCAHVVKKTVE